MVSCGQHGDEELDEAALRVLVSRATAADPDAWEAIYRRSHPRLFSYARRRLPSDTAADDAVSETMLRALDKINSFTWRGAGFDAWLYGILRNVVLESHRQAGRTTASHAPEVSVPGPLDALVRRDELAEVRAAFDQLPADDQELLELRVVAGLSAEQVGSVLGRKAGAVRMAQSRALGRLRLGFQEASGGH